MASARQSAPGAELPAALEPEGISLFSTVELERLGLKPVQGELIRSTALGSLT